MQTHFRLHCPDIVTLPQCFRQHGYHTQSLGKVFHSLLDDPPSWSAHSWEAQDQMYGKPENQAAVRKAEEQLRSEGKLLQIDTSQRDPKTRAVLKLNRKGSVRAIGPAWEDPDVPDNALRDGMLADKAIEVLGQVKEKPFFLAVGFYRPHLPFVAPKKYFDLYRPQNLPLASNPFPPKDVPQIALTDSAELRTYSDIPKLGPVSDVQARGLIHAYYAAVSYVDAQIGRVLAELDRLGLRQHTVVVLWGDHGWHLGEHAIWGKQTDFEIATRAPLIFSAPGQVPRGVASHALVEFVNVYPTLVDLCGLPMPEGLEGTSLAPLMKSPERPWKSAVFSQYPRPQQGSDGAFHAYGPLPLHGMGQARRTARRRRTLRSPGRPERERQPRWSTGA